MVPHKFVGRIRSSRTWLQRIFFWQCSCMIFSNIFSPVACFRFPSRDICRASILMRSSERSNIAWKNSSCVVLRRCSKMSLLDQKTQQVFGTQCHTQLLMSTSATSDRWGISETSRWDKEMDEQTAGNQEIDTDGNESTVLLQEHQAWSNAVDSALKTLKKKRTSLQSELKKAEDVEAIKARAQLLVSNLYLFQDGVKSAIVNDWENDGKEVELTLDSTGKYSSASDEADALFSIVRKLKRGSRIVADLLKETDTAWEVLTEAELDLQSACGGDGETGIDEGRLAIVKERLVRTARATKFQAPTIEDDNSKTKSIGSSQNRRERKPALGTPASNVRKLISPGGCIVLVGRNRRGNEHLSMTVARGNDIWMHSRGCPGAHVIVQNRRGGPTVTEECLQFGADLAIFYSDLRNEEKAEVTAAEPKHIQKPRGAPLGAVKLREEWKTFVGRPGQVPDELKEAREESGQTDEYHMFDKAKHRRRTKQVREEDRAKKRRQQREKKNQR